MDAAQWPQGIGLVKQMEEMTPNNTCTSRPILEKKPRPQEQLNCPRCNSNNTKFCYYNNYSLSQPRYFCKSCRRYWTEGGTLRNVPVGGGSRKNKRSSSSKLPDLNPPNLSQFSSQNPKIHESQDLNLAFPMPQDYHGVSHHVLHQVPKVDAGDTNRNNLSSSSTNSSALSTLEMLRTGMASRGFSSLIANPIQDSNVMYTTGFPLHEMKPNLRFSIDGEFENRNGNNNLQGLHGGGGRLLFPFGEQNKEISIPNEVAENKGQGNSAEYWNGIFSGRSW